ncbi:MAG: cytochrome c [Azospirillaceae bacterium]
MARALAALAGALALVTAGSVAAEEDLPGSMEYLASCAACHGAGGRGDGPVAQHLNVPPSDLTALAANNGGDFPFAEVLMVIDGRRMPTVHGERAMPVWGDRYSIEVGPEMGPQETGDVVRGRILALAQYLEAIQQ